MTNTFRTFTAAALIAASTLAAAPAHAGRVIWSVGIGAPGVAIGASNGYYAPAPVYYAPAPVYYAPPPAYYVPNYYTPFYFGATYHSRPRPRHHHFAPPPRYRHMAPAGRHPGARPVHHGRPPHRHR